MSLLDQDRHHRFERRRQRNGGSGAAPRTASIGSVFVALILGHATGPGVAQTATPDDGFASVVLASVDTVHTTLADGGILVGSDFIQVDGENRGRIVRLSSNGVLDESFDPAPDGRVEALLEQPDGKILVAGRFSTIARQPRSKLARLNSDGSLDTGFLAEATADGAIPVVWDLALQRDGKILVVGGFDELAGVAADSVGRLLPDGTFDPGFDPPDGLFNVRRVVVDRFGRILIAGGFVQPAPARALARLNRDGSLDSSFAPGVLSGPEALALEADGTTEPSMCGTFLVEQAAAGRLTKPLSPYVSYVS